MTDKVKQGIWRDISLSQVHRANSPANIHKYLGFRYFGV